MNVVICGGGTPLGAELAALLGPEHALTWLGEGPPGTSAIDPGEWELESLSELLDGQDVLIWLGLLNPPNPRGLDGEQALLDVGGRITYNLLSAAQAKELSRVLVVTSLTAFRPYDRDMLLTETFPTRPTTAPQQLAEHLAESVCLEFVHETRLHAVLVRLGDLVREDEVDAEQYDPFWLDLRDAAGALAAIVVAEAPEQRRMQRGGTVHVCARRPDAAVRSGLLRRWTGFTPEHNFGYVPEEVEA